jgi:FG-GAP-like repeat
MAADVNGDGIPDIGVLEPGTLAIFLGNGDGTFAPPFYLGSAPNPGDVLTQDLHGQSPTGGLPDIIAMDAINGISVLLNLTK